MDGREEDLYVLSEAIMKQTEQIKALTVLVKELYDQTKDDIIDSGKIAEIMGIKPSTLRGNWRRYQSNGFPLFKSMGRIWASRPYLLLFIKNKSLKAYRPEANKKVKYV